MTVHLKITGKVQGVFYRASAQEVGQELGLEGWVKNTEEGDVEAVVNGPEDQVQSFITWCRKGPPQAIVTHVSVSHLPNDESFHGFRIIRG